METILSAMKSWTKKEIKESAADWNQNDPSVDSYVKNRPFYEENGVVHKLDSKYLDIPEHIATTDDVQEAIDAASAAQSAADNAQTAANNAQTTADGKMNITNPSGTGSFSMNRKANSFVGDFSSALGKEVIAPNASETVLGEFNIEYPNFFEEKETTVSSSSRQYGTNLTLADEYVFDSKSGTFSLVNPTKVAIEIPLNNESAYKGKYLSYDENTIGELINVSKYSSKWCHVNAYAIKSVRNSAARGTYAHIVGNGTSDEARSNAHTLDWEGNAWYQGDVYVGSTSGTNRDEGSKKLATEEYVDAAIGGIEIPEGSGVELDTTLTEAGKAAEAKATGDAIKNLSDSLSAVATSGSYNDLEDKPEIPNIDNFATTAYVDEKFASVGDSMLIYKQNEEPVDAEENALWIDLDAECAGASSGGNGDGLTTTEKNLILNLFRNAAYISGGMKNTLTQLETLWSGSGDDTGGGDTHSHSYTSSVTTAATCTTNGVRTYTCSCGESYTEVIQHTGHKFVDGICTVCGYGLPLPDTPEVTLTSISATYSGGSVPVGTAVSALTGIVVTAHYSNGTSETITGYTLTGAIAEGSNTITVRYGGKTTTFTVIGVAESSGSDIDIPESNLLGYYDMRTALTDDNHITDLSGNGRDILFYPDNGYYENGYMYRGDKASNWINEAADYSITDGAKDKYSYGENVTMFVTISNYANGTTPLLNTGVNNTQFKQMITFQNGVVLYHQNAGFNNVAGDTKLTANELVTICAVISATEEKIYINGTLKNTSLAKGGTFGTCFHMLMGYSNASDANTKIHNAAVYNAALSDSEVSEISATLFANAGGVV